MKQFNILLLANTTHNTQCVADHIAAVTSDSSHNWYVENALNNRVLHHMDFRCFDAVGFHYSIRPHDPYYCPEELYQKVREYRGTVFQFLQDEYQRVNVASRAMIDLGVDVLFTIVRPELYDVAYDHPALGKMKKVTVMTGYAPDPEAVIEFNPIRKRNVDIFYRSRACPYWVGSLANDKVKIAEEISKKADEYDLKVDISVREEDRVYGEEWINRLSGCRATLATESGSSVWDREGKIEQAVNEALGNKPGASFEEIFEEVIKPYDGELVYSGISPRVFEAAILKTPLIMFPGWYNGLLEPNVHYIKLERDFSNLDNVIKTLRDDNALTQFANKAHRDLIASKKYGQSKLAELVNVTLENCIAQKQFSSEKATQSSIQLAISELKKRHKFRNRINNAKAEFRFGLEHCADIMTSRRYRGWGKIRRLFEGFNRYISYLKPRLNA